MEAKSRRPRRPARILLVDDDNAAILLTRLAFEESHVVAELDTATGVREAMERLRAAAQPGERALPDLVLLDLNLRDGSGHDILAAMKREAALAEIPVVILSTSSSPSDLVRAREGGAARYIVKPTVFDEFIHAINGLQDFFPSAA